MRVCVCARACVHAHIQGILERLNAGEVVVGDGGYVMQLERRGYVKAGHWTPEAAVEHPEAGKPHPWLDELVRGAHTHLTYHPLYVV